MEGRRQETYAAALAKAGRDFAARDPVQAAREAGGDFDAAISTIVLKYLGAFYGAHHPSGRVFALADPDRVPKEATRLLILHYLVKTRGTAPRGRWISFRELPGGDVYLPAFNRRAVDWLVHRFGEDPPALAAAAVRLGGEPAGLGDAAATVSAFPLLPVTFVLWRGDEEVSTAGNVLFDETAPLHLDTEDLAVVAGETLAALSRA